MAASSEGVVPDPDPIVVVRADPRWADEFKAIGAELRRGLGDVAVRVDHVGSTAVAGLDAKPVIDIQLSVRRLEPEGPFRRRLEGLGYELGGREMDRSQRIFREPRGSRRVHLHVRAAGGFDEQLNLLFRDFLRSHGDAAREYARVKHELADRFRNDRDGYVQAKEPTVWRLLLLAHTWLQETGWTPGPSDA